MDSQYARTYRKLYEHHWWWRARESLILTTLRGYLPASRRLRLLDVGCGDGLFFDRLTEFGDVEGVESDTALVDPHGPHFSKIYTQPFDDQFQPNARYDVILMLDVLEHLADPAGSLRRAVELLSDDGILLMTVPAFNVLWTAHDDWNHHFVRYTKASLAHITQQAGLEIRQSRYFFYWTFPVKLVMRFKESLFGQSIRPAAVPPSPINVALYAWSRLERILFGWLPMPLGSSLLMVASKASAIGSSVPDARTENCYDLVKSC